MFALSSPQTSICVWSAHGLVAVKIKNPHSNIDLLISRPYNSQSRKILHVPSLIKIPFSGKVNVFPELVASCAYRDIPLCLVLARLEEPVKSQGTTSTVGIRVDYG